MIKKPTLQGGVQNYLGKQKEVTAPIKWKSSPDHPETELAYITKAEKDLLVKKDGVNRGPSGIMSLNGFGSADPDQNVSGSQMSAAETGNFSGFSGTGAGEGPELPPGVDRKPSQLAQDIRSAAIAAGAGQRVNPGFFDSRNTVSPAELARAKAFNPTAFRQNRGGGIMNFITSGGLLGNLARSLGQRLGLGKRFNEPTYNMSQFNNLPLGGSAAFQNLDIRDKFNRKNNLEIDPRLEDYLEFKQLSPDAITFEEYLENIENAPTGILQSSVLPNNNLIADATYDQQKNVLENILNTQDTGIGEFIEDKEQKDKRQQDLLNEILTG